MKRAHYLDSLRGLAVVWMIIFHGAYDMKMLGFIDWNFAQGFWYAFPRVIAFTFLFCVGASLNYSHRPNIKWRPLGERSLKLLIAASLISVATYFTYPSQWIYFGTLHCILVGSILGALVVNHRKLAFSMLLVILFGQYLFGFDIKWVSSILQRPSLDFIPIYPWFWAILSGIILEPFLSKNRQLQKMAPIKSLELLGQHSLKIYLIHQPVIFGLLWGIKTITKP